MAMLSVTLVYMLVNVAYYAVVDKTEILDSGRIVAALYFGRLWGVDAERVRLVILTASNHADQRSKMGMRTDRQRNHRLFNSWEHPGSTIHAWSRHATPLSSADSRYLSFSSRARARERRRSPLFILLR